MKGSEFIFDNVNLLQYHLQKTSLKRIRSSCIGSSEWLKNKKATVNPKYDNDNCFHYAIIPALNHKHIKNHPERISNVKPFINQYDWKGINFPSHKEGQKKFESNKSITVNILFVPYNAEKIRLAYESKHKFKCENQVILLMITGGKKWHYLAVKKLFVLLRGVIANHNGDFYCLDRFQSYRTENKIKKDEKVCNDHDYCYVEMPNEDDKILKYNFGEKSLKAKFLIYADLECLLEKMHSRQNNFEKFYTEKKLSTCLLVIQYLQVVCLTQQKTNLIVTMVKIVWKFFAKT